MNGSFSVELRSHLKGAVMLKTTWTVCLLLASFCVANATAEERSGLDWSQESPRDEIRPEFAVLPDGGPDGEKALSIRADGREGLMGWWQTEVPVAGEKFYRFAVEYQTSHVELDRRTAVARILWQDAEGNRVLRVDPSDASYRQGERPFAEPEFPRVTGQSGEWTKLESVYAAPPDAVKARIELHFRWGAPDSSIRWSLPRLSETTKPKPRVVRLAAVHLRPTAGTTPREKREQFAPLIAEAAEKNVDLLVLPETLTYYGTKKTYAEIAESIPGPSTDYFGTLAKQHDLYIVAGLIERDEHLIYNVAVLIGPDGKVAGKYRKVTLPRSEIDVGVTPGREYPVFETGFGKVGMMVCYDGFFPEVARELSNRGAEVIAWPVWGCNPLLASARACENHVYLISSTYTGHEQDWIITGVYGHDGKALAEAKEFGTLAIAEVDLNHPLYWHSLGDFGAQIQAHRPVVPVMP